MHADPVQPPVRPGDTIAGKYQVERLIGSGGVGVVVAALHLELGERVAIKFLLPRAAKNVVDVARFCREAQAASRLKSEHVTRVLDTGVLDDGAPYMVMEYLDGWDLHDLLRRGGPLSIPDVLQYVLQAAVALAEAHMLGIVHRDIKPSNLFLTRHPDGTPLVKILDFGIAKASVDTYAGVGPQDLTKTSALLGSPLYMSPEQIRSTKSVDARSDIWSIGIVLYELLCGATPFDSESLTGVVAGVIGSSPPPLGMRRADLPPGLVTAVDRCLKKDPADRFQSVAELAAALEPFAPESAKVSVMRILRLQAKATGHMSPWAKTPSAASFGPEFSEPPSATARTLQSEASHPLRRRRRAGLIGVAAITGPALISLVLWYALREPPARSPLLSLSASGAAVHAPPLDTPPQPPPAISAVRSSAVPNEDASVRDAALEARLPVAAPRSTRPVRTGSPPAAPKPRQPASATAKSGKDTAVPLMDETVDTRR